MVRPIKAPLVSRYERQRARFLEQPFDEQRAIDILVAAADLSTVPGFYDVIVRLKEGDPTVAGRIKSAITERLEPGAALIRWFPRLLDLTRYRAVDELDSEILHPILQLNLLRRKSYVKRPNLSQPANAPLVLETKIFTKGLQEGILAHGVDSNSGGLSSLLNIMLEGQIGWKNYGAFYGLLAMGDPDDTVTSHGPYYVILSRRVKDLPSRIFPEEISVDSPPTPDFDPEAVADLNYALAKGRLAAARWNISQEELHTAYLVPSNFDQEVLMGALDNALAKGLLTGQERNVLAAKLIIYEEFLAAPAGAFG